MLHDPTRAACVTRIFSLCLVSFAGASGDQAQKPSATATAFEVVSVKHTGNIMDGGRNEGGRHYVRPLHGPRFTGAKLSAENNLGNIIAFAFSPLVKPQKIEGMDWIYGECYAIDAIAPPGTTIEGAQAMLRKVLAERFGLKYRLVDRATPVYALVLGAGKLRLIPATGTDPDPLTGRMSMGAFKRKSASLADLALFLSSLTDQEVVDRTGIEGKFRFDLDWTKEIADTMHEFGPRGDPSVVFRGVKALGLKLEPRKEQRKAMVIDRVNREPTPN